MLMTCWKTTVHLIAVALSITLLVAHQRWSFLSTEDENIMAYMASSAIWSLWGIALDEAHTALKGSSHQGYWLTVRYGQYLETGQYLLTHPAVLCAGILGAVLVVVCQYLAYRLVFGTDVWCRYFGYGQLVSDAAEAGKCCTGVPESGYGTALGTHILLPVPV